MDPLSLTGLATSAAALAATISTVATVGDPGHDDRSWHNDDTVNLAPTAGSSCTSANKAGTFPEGCTTGFAASAVVLASMISTTATAGAPGLDDGPHANGVIIVASKASTTSTFTKDITDTHPVEATCCTTTLTATATALALPATTISTTSSCQWVYNADNNGGGNVVPPEFDGDGAGPAGDTQQHATATGAYVNNDNNKEVNNTLACTAGRPTIEHPVLGPDLPSSPEVHPAVHNNSLTMVPPVTMSPAHHPVPSYLGEVLHTIGVTFDTSFDIVLHIGSTIAISCHPPTTSDQPTCSTNLSLPPSTTTHNVGGGMGKYYLHLK